MNQKTITISLNTPIRHGGILSKNVVEVVSLRKPIVKDLLGLDFSGEKSTSSMTILISRISGIPLAALHEMDLGDFLKLSDAAAKLMERGP